jgi:outer membrane receptor protein involved in Fe transport
MNRIHSHSRTRLWLVAAAFLLGSAAAPAAAQDPETGTIRGKVTAGADLRPLSGVQVSIPGTGRGALTNNRGEFLIVGVPAGPHTARAQMIGYTTGERQVTVAAGETATLDFQLAEQALALDEVVVTGTAGAARRREIGNSITSVRSETLENETILSAQDAITGTAPSLQVNLNGGDPGSGGTVRIRGANSMTQGNRPLIYIDGVRMESGMYPGSYSNQAASPLDDINPNDIDRIEVVKGAAATTLYGTEASGGVIQIFTKKGTAGAPQWTLEVTQGLSNVGNVGPGGESKAYLEKYPTGDDLFLRQWLKNGHQQAYNLSVRGGSDGAHGMNYYVSGQFTDETGVINEQGERGLGLRGNLGFNPVENLTVQFNSAFSQRHIEWMPLGNLAKSFSLNVFRGPYDYVDDDDRVFFDEFDTQENINHFVSGLEFRYAPSAKFNTKLNLGLDFTDNDYHRTESFGSLLEPEGYRFARRWNSQTRTVDLQSSYLHSFGKLSTSTSAGFQIFQNRLLEVNGISRSFAGPGNPTLNTGSRQVTNEDRLEEVNAGFFVQELLGWADKWFLTLGARVDGNSAFGEDYGLQMYPKASLSYVISDEAFWPAFFESAKLRLAYGESGKAPGYFDAEKTWNPISALGGRPGVTPATRGNPNLGPERTSEIEGGFEFSALEGRLAVDASYYHQTTDNALIEMPQDPTTGYLDAQIDNAGTFINKGFELGVSGTLVRSDRVTWDLGVIASTLESEIVDLGGSSSVFLGGSLTPGMFARRGYPLPAYFGPVLLNPDEIGKPKTEERYFGPMYPTRTISANTAISLGARFTATARVEHQGGHYQLSHTAWRNAQRGVWPPCFDVAQKIDAGQLNQLTARERYECGNKFIAHWANYISPADFIKLRSVAVTYRVPENVLGGRLGNLAVTLGGRNLWTSTDYVGVDPEAVDDNDSLTRHEYYQMPVPRVFTLSVRTSF